MRALTSPDLAPEPMIAPVPRKVELLAALGGRSIVLVGMMGAGKSSVGRRLAARLGIPFVDADAEIESGAGMTIPEYFEKYGEFDFRAGEVRVIGRLLEKGPQVLATGGGAFMNADTRAAIRRKGISVWLKADFDVLLRRVRRRNDRPLLKSVDPATTLRRLISEREPVYAEADLSVHSREVPHEAVVDEIMAALVQTLVAADPAPRPDGQEPRAP
jgi:shikimate kinase